MSVRFRHIRYSSFDRIRHSGEFLAWLTAQATRTGYTAEELFDAIVANQYSYIDVELLGEASEPVNTVLPTITGTAQVGVVLTAHAGTWTGEPAPTFTYQWQADGADISGATASTYTPVVGDVGKVIRVIVTGTNSSGSATANSAATTAVIAAA